MMANTKMNTRIMADCQWTNAVTQRRSCEPHIHSTNHLEQLRQHAHRQVHPSSQLTHVGDEHEWSQKPERPQVPVSGKRKYPVCHQQRDLQRIMARHHHTHVVREAISRGAVVPPTL